MADKDTSDYAFWDFPAQSLRVTYSLPLFQEIDFIVNEGYRKIPHGGIEVAGLLFGTISKEEIRIEALRPIECEHAAGPSLNFSEKDLAALELQIQSSLLDRELEKFKPLGWFLGHTRSGLEMTETEAKHFARFFPGPGRVAIIVKPERFQPTRFACLVRPAAGPMPLDGLSTAIILPLSGRSNKPIPAPAPSAIAKPLAPPAETLDEEIVVEEPVAEAEAPASIWKTSLEAESDRPDHRKLARDRTRIIEEAYALPAPAPVQASPTVPFRPAALPSLPRSAARYMPSGSFAEPVAPKSILNARSLTTLALAALLGCLVGYIAYLQLPAPVIPIDARPLDQTIVISWPPDETRNAMYAAIRLNDGAPVPLSAQEKKAGQVGVSATNDFKIEIVARNWIRDSRGILRYERSNSK